MELECGTPISLGLKDVVLYPIQVLDVQQHGSCFNLDISLPFKDGFEDMFVDAFSVEESADMLTKLGLVIEFNGGLNFISLKIN